MHPFGPDRSGLRARAGRVLPTQSSMSGALGVAGTLSSSTVIIQSLND